MSEIPRIVKKGGMTIAGGLQLAPPFLCVTMHIKKRLPLVIAQSILLVVVIITQTTPGDTLAGKIIAMERSALDRWGHGDPSGFLALVADDVVYFDPFQARRLDGRAELERLYESLRDKIRIDKYDMLNPKVQSTDSIAVLTFNLVSYGKQNVRRWNCTEVYRLHPDGHWKIIQTHWSFTKPHAKTE